MVRHLRNSRRLEKSRKLELNLRDFECMAEDVGGPERVSAQCEEVIVNPDLFDLEDLCPAFGQRLLESCAWRDEGSWQGSADRVTQFSRQADTLPFAGLCV